MSLVVRVMAPTGRDAELIAGVLRQHGLAAEVFVDLRAVLEGSGEGVPVGPLLIAEEALGPERIRVLGEFVRGQPEWSDVPILILTGTGRETAQTHRLDDERLPLGSPILLERPIRTASLVSSVRAALRARKRQYEVREVLRERDRALESLRQERETLQATLDSIPVGVLLAKASGEIVFGNRSFERILRHPLLPTPDIAAHGQWIAFHSDGRRVRGEEYPLPRAMRSGRPVAAEDYLYQRGDGTRAWVSLAAAPIFDSHGLVTGGVVAITDIDEQKRAAADLRRSEERFRRLIETASVGVMIGDTGGGITYVNPTLLQLLGYEAEDVVRGNLRGDVLTPAQYVEADHRAVLELHATGTATPYQKELRAKDGRLIPLLVGATLIPAPHESGVADEVAVFLTDLSSQKKAETALIQSEKLAAVGRLAASISHEINNPLESVTNLLYLARQENSSPEQQRYLELADQELRRVTQIASQTLRFHRQSTRPRAISTEELIEPTLALYQGRIANSHVELKIERRGAGLLTCYEGEIRQVLNNLIGNAIEAMRTGGTLVVRTGPARLGKNDAAAVRITVADTGYGIPPAVRERIFEPFYTTKGINGTGLGLWISMGIAEKHGGRLQVRSAASETGRSGTGTVFSLVLPVETSMGQGSSAPV